MISGTGMALMRHQEIFKKTTIVKGGPANDPVNAEAQDSRNSAPCVRNNANMSTRGDGVSPRMQMYLWSAGANAKINSPAAIAGNHPATSSTTFGPCIATTAISGNLVIADAADGCAAFANAAAIRAILPSLTEVPADLQ